MISPPRRPHSPRWRACGRALSRLYTPSARRRRDPLARALWTIERFVAITRLLYVYVYLCTTTSRGTSELPSNTHTDTAYAQTQSRGAHVRARFWLSICLSVERDTFFSHRHTAETTVTSRVCFIRRVTRRPSVESHLHCTHRVPSTQGCPHATSPRAA